jgi:hypothetical protein
VLAFDESAADVASSIVDVFERVSSAGLEQLNTAENLSLMAIVVDERGKAERGVGLKTMSRDIIFLENDGGTWKRYNEAAYISPRLFTAAVVSDFDGYVCSVDRLLKRLSVVAERYENKAKELESELCDYPINELSMLRRNASASSVDKLVAAAGRIKAANEMLANNSCEVLY